MTASASTRMPAPRASPCWPTIRSKTRRGSYREARAQIIIVADNETFEKAARIISGVTTAAYGTITINDNGTAGDANDDFLVYTQVADYNGTDSFTFSVTSGGVTETAT